MTYNYTGTKFVEILDPLPLEQVGWYCKVLSEVDYSTVIAQVFRFQELTFQKDKNGVGGGSITIASDDPIWTTPLPAGQTIALIDQQAIWQVYEDGILRGEFFAEDVEEDVATESGDRVNVIAGRGLGSVLDWVIYPNTPGAAPGEVSNTGYPLASIVQAYNDAQTRGSIPFVDLTFNSTTDSTGLLWTESFTLSYQHGDTLFDLMNQWIDQMQASWRMLTGFRLWIEKVGGTDRTATVVFPLGESQYAQSKKRTRRDLANVVWAAGSGGATSIATDGASIAKWGRREKWIEAGSVGGSAGTAKAAAANLELFKAQRVSREVVVRPDGPGRRVFVDYDVQDWITVEGLEGDTDATELQVKVITVVVNVDGVSVELGLGTRWDAREVEVQKQMQRLESKKVPAKGVAKKTGSPSSIASRSVGDLKDVDTTTVIQGDTLIFNSVTQVFETTALPTPGSAQATEPTNPSVGQIWVDTDAQVNLTVGDGSGSYLLPPNSPSALDDEFDDTFSNSGPINGLNAKWLKRNLATSSWLVLSRSKKAGSLLFDIPTGQTDQQALYQSVLSQDFRAVTKATNFLTGSRQMWGLFMVDASGNGPCITLDDHGFWAAVLIRQMSAWAQTGTISATWQYGVGSDWERSHPLSMYMKKLGTAFTVGMTFDHDAHPDTWATMTWTQTITLAFVGFGRIYQGGDSAARIGLDYFRIG